MDKALKSSLFSCILFALLISSSAQDCNSYSFSNNRRFRTCNELSALSSSIHWTLDQANNTVQIAFRHRGTTESRWVAWALNPSGQRMVGSQAIVAYQNSSGIRAFTSNIVQTQSLEESRLSFEVSDISATLDRDVMTIYARLQLTTGLLSTNQVWQEGPLDSASGNPGMHPLSGDNTRSIGTINFRTGQTGAGGGSVATRQRRRNTHGVLNAVSWGTLMPMGVITARYLKVFKFANPAWFYLHAACQSSAYVVGVAGWATGLKLGEESVGYKTHRAIGITLFCLGTLQVFALLLRPKPDHKYRIYWNIYHHGIGYSVIILSIINVYEGLDILSPGLKWKWIYGGILVFLGAVAVVLEALTWFIVIRRKKQSNMGEQNRYSTNGINGVSGGPNGYSA